MTLFSSIPYRRAVLAVLGTCLTLAALGPVQGAPAEPVEPVPLRFGHFFEQPIGPRGLALSPALRAADGRVVRLVGYMVAQERPQPGRFMLTPLPIRLSEHADGEADDLPPSTVTVWLDSSQRERIVAHREGLVELVGRLSVGRDEGADGRVSWVRLQLDRRALNDVALDPAAAHAGHAHSAH